ncbi:hypothetical protein NDA03_06045 [Trichocoleus sp. Lan]|uniref:hypothetical protein n=1 Tax=Trichocoleus sp. Lan TaxID=2933927 RepID=UPI003298425B
MKHGLSASSINVASSFNSPKAGRLMKPIAARIRRKAIGNFQLTQGGKADETARLLPSQTAQLSTFNSPKAGRLMKRSSRRVETCSGSTFNSPKAGRLMKPRPLKPLPTQADKYIFVG